MRKLLSVVIGLMVASALVAAQTKAPAIKKVKDQITFSEDVKVGSTVLKAGRYEVASSADGGQLTFRKMIPDVSYPNIWVFDMKEQPVVAKVTAKALAEKVRGTSLDTDDAAGLKTLKSLTLDGTNVTFTFN